VPRLGEHRRREVGAHDLGLGEAARDNERGRARSRPEIKNASHWLIDTLERGFEWSEGLGISHLVPNRGESIELPPRQRAQEAPGLRPSQNLVRGEPRELASELLEHG
jgi:hypothetical protein